MGHSEENIKGTAMGAVALIDGTKTGNITKSGEIWRTKEQFIGKTGPLVIGDRVYSVDDGGIFTLGDRARAQPIGVLAKPLGPDAHVATPLMRELYSIAAAARSRVATSAGSRAARSQPARGPFVRPRKAA